MKSSYNRVSLQFPRHGVKEKNEKEKPHKDCCKTGNNQKLWTRTVRRNPDKEQPLIYSWLYSFRRNLWHLVKTPDRSKNARKVPHERSRRGMVRLIPYPDHFGRRCIYEINENPNFCAADGYILFSCLNKTNIVEIGQLQRVESRSTTCVRSHILIPLSSNVSKVNTISSPGSFNLRSFNRKTLEIVSQGDTCFR
jgi:hypothetical protein